MNKREQNVKDQQQQQTVGINQLQYDEDNLQVPSFSQSQSLFDYLQLFGAAKKCLFIAACTLSLFLTIILINMLMNPDQGFQKQTGNHIINTHQGRSSLKDLFKTSIRHNSSYLYQKTSKQFKLEQMATTESQLQRPSYNSVNESDYDMTNTINLWNISPSAKEVLFKKYRSSGASHQHLHYNNNFMQISYGKDQEFHHYSTSFQTKSDTIKWSSIALTPNDTSTIQRQFKSALKRRKETLKDIRNKYVSEYQGRWGSIIQQKKITYNQFLNALEFSLLTGKSYKKDPLLRMIYSKEKKYYNNKYQTSFFRKQLPVCILTPTFNNINNDRYLWNIESILQQDYEQFKHIIIDDASTDGTAEKIAKYLRFKGVKPEQVVLIKNRVKKTAMENIYYAAHKYCNYNEIIFIVDGDDQLIGTQVFKLYNAIYQAKKYYALYSNHLYYDQDSPNPLRVGLSQDYPIQVKQHSTYRKAYHSYSHLRSVLSDLFLLQRSESLKDEKGEFYWTICDNAMYFPALQLSCGRVDYINELTYWYNANTGINDRLTPRTADYEKVRHHIGDIQKHYHCINHIFGNLTQTEHK